jgi:2-methylcitrate dehydratase PrpD
VFANGELINALDFDAILPPGHVAPYVVPLAMAAAEARGASGQDLIAAVAVGHEMSYRIGKAMDYLRDTRDGKLFTPNVLGYACTIFGATASALRSRRSPPAVVANALGIAGTISPVNSLRALMHHLPVSTVKYTPPGPLCQNALAAADMAELGHTGDLEILDDVEFGYPRFIGTIRWDIDRIVDGLGTTWAFPAHNTFKPYPLARASHCLIDAMTEVLQRYDIRPEEIEGIKVYVEGVTQRPLWLNNDIGHVQDAQFAIGLGIAIAAHRIKPGKEWLDPQLVFSPSVRRLKDKVEAVVHPDYVEQLSKNAASRPARVEIRARGTTFIGERLYPKGSPSPDPATVMTTAELVEKFRHNARDVLVADALDDAVDLLLHLERVRDVAAVTRCLRQVTSAAAEWSRSPQPA